jgi:hypothetical protein
MTTATTPDDIVGSIRAGFELVESSPGRYMIQFPFMFRSGDWLPIGLERSGRRWRLTDDSGLYEELSLRTRKNFYRGRLRERLDAALAHTGVHVEDGNFVREARGDDWAEAFADFVMALVAAERIIDEAERRRPSRWAGR